MLLPLPIHFSFARFLLPPPPPPSFPCSTPAYGEAGLELAPTRRLPSQGVPLPRVGAMDWSSGEVTEEQKRTLEAAMYRLREQVAQRRVLAKPCFQDFDRFVWVCVYISVHLCIHVYVRMLLCIHAYIRICIKWWLTLSLGTQPSYSSSLPPSPTCLTPILLLPPPNPCPVYTKASPWLRHHLTVPSVHELPPSAPQQ